MRVFVAGATGALGRHLVPGLVAAGHEVTATTRTPGKVAQLREAGAEPAVVDGLDREAVVAAVLAAGPEVIVHQMTALADMAYLTTAATRLGINYLSSARVRRETYVEDWLPEPVVVPADLVVQRIRAVVNPDKLGHVGPVSDVARRAPGGGEHGHGAP